jgi:hypothetical protein
MSLESFYRTVLNNTRVCFPTPTYVIFHTQQPEEGWMLKSKLSFWIHENILIINIVDCFLVSLKARFCLIILCDKIKSPNRKLRNS